MTLLQLKRAVLAELGGRNLKNPAIRANALEKICTFYYNSFFRIFIR